jgi:hypothetical protein
MGLVYAVGDTGKLAGMTPADPDDDPLIDLAERRRLERAAVEEGGGGQSEGFELAEQELIEHTSHGDEHGSSRITRDGAGEEEEPADASYGDADEEHPND